MAKKHAHKQEKDDRHKKAQEKHVRNASQRAGRLLLEAVNETLDPKHGDWKRALDKTKTARKLLEKLQEM